jgi:protein phosphatase methylesterase 1
LKWRTELEATCPFWEAWFSGLSATFLAAPCPKLLILAGTDRLDTPLNIAQMQGKFQLALIPAAGHAIQEDEPAKTAESIVSFLRVLHRTVPSLPPAGGEQ